MSDFEVPCLSDQELIEILILRLFDPGFEGYALSGLVEKRGKFKDLALLLWYSSGTVAVLTQEILAVYPTYFSSAIPASKSSRACNALTLLQTIASHPETRIPFLQAKIPLYFYAFLNCTNNGNAFESLRRTSLDILGSLVKVDDVEAEVITFLLQSEVIPLCLQIMEMGNEVSKEVATFIIPKILLDDSGLRFVCATSHRFFSVTNVLATMVTALVNEPSTKILKHVIRCYLRLTYDRRALVALRVHFPKALKDGTFAYLVREDRQAVQWLQQLLGRLEGASLPGTGPAEGGGGFLADSIWEWRG